MRVISSYLQVAQLWQRDCVSSIDNFKGLVNLRLNFRLMGYVCAVVTLHNYITQFTFTYSII